MRRILATTAPAEVILIRLVVGCVFLSEGIQKFLFPAALGVGRFAQIGIPAPASRSISAGGEREWIRRTEVTEPSEVLISGD
jgi:putative oxidoreductase